MNIQECREQAKRFWPQQETSFQLVTPTGKWAAKWIDPYLGLFHVPEIGGLIHLTDTLHGIEHHCTEITVTPKIE